MNDDVKLIVESIMSGDVHTVSPERTLEQLVVLHGTLQLRCRHALPQRAGLLPREQVLPRGPGSRSRHRRNVRRRPAPPRLPEPVAAATPRFPRRPVGW